MHEQFPNQAPEQPLQPEPLSRLSLAVRHTVPVVAEAFSQETGIPTTYGEGQQAELSANQQFGVGVARFAMRHAAQVIETRRAA
jgi:hypothetical protein